MIISGIRPAVTKAFGALPSLGDLPGMVRRAAVSIRTEAVRACVREYRNSVMTGYREMVRTALGEIGTLTVSEGATAMTFNPTSGSIYSRSEGNRNDVVEVFPSIVTNAGPGGGLPLRDVSQRMAELLSGKLSERLPGVKISVVNLNGLGFNLVIEFQ